MPPGLGGGLGFGQGCVDPHILWLNSSWRPGPRFAHMPVRIVITWAEAADMQVLGSASIPVAVSVGTATALVPGDAAWPPGRAAGRQAGRPDAHAEEPFDRVARLAAMVLGTPQAYVTIAGERPSPGRSRTAVRDIAGLERAAGLV